MINEKDVITLKIPFPTIKSPLAYKSHMYIVKENKQGNKDLIKCQTAKPTILLNNFIIEEPNKERNPFNNTTLIDLEKEFIINKIIIPLELRTNKRYNICDELYQDIINNLNAIIYHLNTYEVLEINFACSIYQEIKGDEKR